MNRVNREVELISRQQTSKIKTAKLTKANLEQLKEQLHDNLARVQPRFGCDALEFHELVCGFPDRIHNMAEEKAWRKYLKQRE